MPRWRIPCALFEEGTKLVDACTTELDKAEQQVVKLIEGAGRRAGGAAL